MKLQFQATGAEKRWFQAHAVEYNKMGCLIQNNFSKADSEAPLKWNLHISLNYRQSNDLSIGFKGISKGAQQTPKPNLVWMEEAFVRT